MVIQPQTGEDSDSSSAEATHVHDRDFPMAEELPEKEFHTQEVESGCTEMSGVQKMAKACLLGASEWSVSILERMEMDNRRGSTKNKRKRLTKSSSSRNSSSRKWRKNKMSKYGNGDVGLENKLVAPLLYTKERLNACT
jgi:hypothetical protein